MKQHHLHTYLPPPWLWNSSWARKPYLCAPECMWLKWRVGPAMRLSPAPPIAQWSERSVRQDKGARDNAPFIPRNWSWSPAIEGLWRFSVKVICLDLNLSRNLCLGVIACWRWTAALHSSGAVWESRWTSWAVRPNEPSGFRGRKELLNRASALVTTCP